MVKKGSEISESNSFGVVGVVFGIMSILTSSLGGVIMGVVGLVFSMKQKKVEKNKWSKAGVVLNIIGIILGIIAFIALTYYAANVMNLQGAY